MNKNWYISSTGKGLSLTIGGLAVGGFIPVIAVLAGLAGVDLSENEIAEALGAVVALVSITMTLIGLIRKIYYQIKNRKK